MVVFLILKMFRYRLSTDNYNDKNPGTIKTALNSRCQSLILMMAPPRTSPKTKAITFETPITVPTSENPSLNEEKNN